MIHFVIRRSGDNEPLALVRLNANESAEMTIMSPKVHPRFGPMAPVHRFGLHAFNLMIGEHTEVHEALSNTLGYRLERVTEAEWESFDAFDLFPVLKLAVAR